jgi:hypothetical protein
MTPLSSGAIVGSRHRIHPELGCTGPPTYTRRRVARPLVAVTGELEQLAELHRGLAVDDEAEGPTVTVEREQHHGAIEVRIAERRRRDEETWRERAERFRHARSISGPPLRS